jgi:two-component system sensor histidine kinase/response regulator
VTIFTTLPINMQIVHIEDNEGDRVLVSKILKTHLPLAKVIQYQRLEEVKSDFLNQSSEENIILLLDLGLPGHSELSALDVLLECNFDRPIIVLTGAGETSLGIKSLKRGAQDFLRKKNLNGEFLKHSIEYSLERYILNRKLVESNKTKDRLFSIIGHDLRSPLVGVLSLIDYLEVTKGEIGQSELSEVLQLIKKSALNTKELLDNLLDWSHLHLDKLSFMPNLNSVEKTISDVVDILEPNCIVKNVKVSQVLDSKDEIYADDKMLACILRNILSNAIKFSHRDSTIEIIGKSIEKHYEISISDSGIGIPVKMQKNLFTGTEVIGREGTAGEGSAGLGLMLAQSFSLKHGGLITVKSEVNKGSTFTIKFPHKMFSHTDHDKN